MQEYKPPFSFYLSSLSFYFQSEAQRSTMLTGSPWLVVSVSPESHQLGWERSNICKINKNVYEW